MTGAGDLALWMDRLVAAWRGTALATPPAALTAAERGLVVAGAATLSAGLTGERELVGARYLDDRRLLGAYLLLYWPVSFAQTASVLGELGRSPGRVLDLGAGPGPGAMAALAAGATQVVAADRSSAALAVAARLADLAGRGARLETVAWQAGAALPAGPFDTIVVGHLLNELDAPRQQRLAEALLDELTPGGRLVLIEPALRDTSRTLLGLRDRLVAGGVTIHAPCFYRGGCPALARPTDWCHAERSLAAPPLLAELARAAALHRDRVKMSYLVVSREPWPEPPPGRLFRIVSEPLHVKGQARYVGCGPEGRHPLGRLDRHATPANQVFDELDRGDVIRVDELTVKGDGLRLGAAAVVERLARAGEAVSAS